MSDICKEIVVFANSRSGTLYVGVANNRRVTGIEDADPVMLRPSNMVRDSIKPDVTMFVRYEIMETGGKMEVIRSVTAGMMI